MENKVASTRTASAAASDVFPLPEINSRGGGENWIHLSFLPSLSFPVLDSIPLSLVRLNRVDLKYLSVNPERCFSSCMHVHCTVAPACTACGHRIAHRKWKETKQHPGTAGPGNKFLSISCGPSRAHCRNILRRRIHSKILL